MTIFVTMSDRRLSYENLILPIRIGKSGFIDQNKGREGDHKTPLGRYRLRFGLYRADRLKTPPPAHSLNPLNLRPLKTNDGWCDDSRHPAYNRFIKRPFNASHEALWREDGAYDIIIVMSHNDSPPISRRGSAVFIHVAQPDDRQTLGCLALTPNDMVKLLPHLQRDMAIEITAR